MSFLRISELSKSISILVCLIASVFAKNVFTLYITIGFGAGFGFGMIYLPAIVSVTMYFERLRSLATGIAVCGSGFGTVVFAPLTNYLIVNYKWQGTLLVIAGIVFFCAVFGYMFKPLDPSLAEPVPPVPKENGNNLINNNSIKYELSNHDGLLSPNNHQQIIRSHSIGHDIAKANGKTSRTADDKSRLALSLSQPLLNESGENVRLRSAGSGFLDRPDALYTGSLHNIAKNRSHNSIHTETDRYGSMTQRIDNVEVCEKSSVCGCIPCSEETQLALTKMMSFSLLKDPVFILFTVSNFLTSIGFNMPYVYIAAQADALQINKTDASYLIATIGAANTVGRIILGYLSDKPWVNRLHVYNMCLTVCGIATALSVFCVEFWGLAAYSIVFGFTIGAYVGELEFFKTFNNF